MALTPILWDQIISGLTVEDTARLGSASYTHLQLIGGYEWLQLAHQDFWRLIDWVADVAEQEYIQWQADQCESDDEFWNTHPYTADERGQGILDW